MNHRHVFPRLLWPTLLVAVASMGLVRQMASADETSWVFREERQDGRRIIAMEAEHCSSLDAGQLAFVSHASGGQVLYCPDEIRAHRGQITVAGYRFRVQTPGRWFVRLRIFAAHHIQNGVYLAFDGKRVTDPDGGDGAVLLPKNGWGWSLRWQGEENTDLVYVDIDQPGEHTLSIVRREPMTYYDKILLTHEDDWSPAKDDPGPAETIASTGAEWQGPPSYGVHGVEDFPFARSGFEAKRDGPSDRAPYLAMADGITQAAAAVPFTGKSGKYALRLEYIPDKKHPIEFSIRVDGKTVGTCLASADAAEEEPSNLYLHDVAIENGQEIEVGAVSKTGSPARWRRIFLYGGPLLPYALD